MTGEAPALTLTGERTLPGIWHENYWFRRHEVAYRWLSGRASGVVLEAGCGEGYGADALRAAGHATQVVAVDYDASSVAHVRATYPEVAVVRGNLVGLPLRSAQLDAVVSLQTVEHLWDQPLFVAECARVLRPSGLLAISTPNRLTFSPGVGRGEKPLNPFHINEFDPEELVELLAARVTVEAVLERAVPPFPVLDPLARPDSEDGFDADACGQQLDQLGGVELVDMKRVQRLLAASDTW